MKTLLRILVICSTLLGTHIAAGAATMKSVNIGNWLAGAYSNDRTGQFNHCAASSTYKSGLLLVFAVSKTFAWSIGFSDPSWNLDLGANYPLSMRIDQGRTFSQTATAIQKNLVEVKLADDSLLFDAFKQGHMLSVFTAGQTFKFQLTDTKAILPALLSCVKSYQPQANPQPSTNPFVTESRREDPPAEAPKENPPAAVEPDRKAEATSLIANILSRSGVNGFEIMSPDEVGKFKSDAGWRAGPTFGTLNIVDNRAAKPEDLNAQLMSSDSKACHSNFVSGMKPDESGLRLFTSCRSTSRTLTIFYSTIKRPKGGYYILATGGYEGGSQGSSEPGRSTQDVDSGLRSAAYRIVEK